MLSVNEREHLWVEKFRPQTIEECILQQRTKSEVLATVADGGKIPNLLFYGPPGCGKTTLAKAMCTQANVDWILFNGSNERGIDAVRDRIVSFASTASLSGNDHKVIIIDESDRLTALAQDALKSEIERFSKTCTFIFTANHPNRLIEALHSRLVAIDFAPKKEEVDQMQAEMFMRVCEILEHESVTYNEAVLVEVIQRFFPDNRRILGELQQYARASNDINEGMLMHIAGSDSKALIEAIVSKKFKDITQWAADNANNDTSMIYEEIYLDLKSFVKPSSIPDAIMILEEYQRFDSSVPSKELHLAAMSVELMTTLEFK